MSDDRFKQRASEINNAFKLLEIAQSNNLILHQVNSKLRLENERLKEEIKSLQSDIARRDLAERRKYFSDLIRESGAEKLF